MPVRRLPTQSRSRHFGGIPEEKEKRETVRNSDHVTRNALAVRNNEAYNTDKSRQTVVLYSPFCIIKNTGHGNFVVGRFHTRARKGIIRQTLACVQSPPPPQTPLFRFLFLKGGGGTGYLERIIHLQTVRQNWRIKSGRFIQN